MALANGVLYRGIWNFPDPKGIVVALDADNGTVLWTDTLDAPLGGGFSISAGTLYVGFGSGTGGRYKGPIEGGLIAYTLP